MHELAGIFGIDLCAYTVISNHYHVVLHVDGEQAKACEVDVIRRWHALFIGHPFTRKFLNGEPLSKAENRLMPALAEWRSRLRLVGLAHRLRTACEALGYRRVSNLTTCRQLLS